MIKKIDELTEIELSELSNTFPFTSIFDSAMTKLFYENNGCISMPLSSKLINKTNNIGLSISGLSSKLNTDIKFKDFYDIENQITKVDKTEKSELFDGIATEQLAKIYLEQGKKNEAIEIYKKISLQKKKKNNTFAKF
jgi:hypothetical protein